jgi:hypothetical protein
VTQLSRLRRRIRLLTIVVAVLGVAVIGLGTRLLVEQTTESESAIPAQVERVVDDYRRAYETLDKELMTELVTEEFRATDSFYRVHVAGNRRGAYRDPAISPSGGPINVLTAGFSHQFEIESGQAIVSGDGPWFVAVTQLQPMASRSTRPPHAQRVWPAARLVRNSKSSQCRRAFRR